MKNHIHLTDQQLVRLFKLGETDTMGILVERYKRGIYSTIILLVKDNVLAEDLFQETFIKIINTINRGGYADEGKFLPWAMRIAHNLCIDHIRKEKTRGKSFVTPSSFNDELAVTMDNAETDIIRHIDYQNVVEWVQKLPEEQREVVVLRHYANLSFKEIAELTNCGINTALGRMRYALVNLRKMMAESTEAVA